VALPPRGSAQDVLLQEVYRREREERFTTVELFARILSGGLGMRSDTLEAMLSAYKNVLTQEYYTPDYTARQRLRRNQVVSKKVKKQLDDDALLKRLEGLNTPEDTAPPKKKAGARRR